jgi:signal transduction histidine kinase
VISLKNRLVLTYALFIGIALAVLIFIMNVSIGTMFAGLIKDNIRERSGEIIDTITEQYNPRSAGFDVTALEALGMCFVHEGYIVRIEDPAGSTIWDARTADMQHCAAVMDEISERMGRYRLNGTVQNLRYPLSYETADIGSVRIETYGPFFYSEAEAGFLASINRVLLGAGTTFILLSAVISFFLASAISGPILRASEAARRIAREYAEGTARKDSSIRISDEYKTKELRELSRSINKLAEELEEGERRQKQLSSDVAHELRTPLTCLRGNVEAMIDGVWEPSPERLLCCHEEILRLTTLVEDLNLLTNLEWENITLDKTEFDLAKLLQSTAEQFYPAARNKNIEIKLDLKPSPVYADYNRLKQVFINLLSNAVKYTDEGLITISVKAVENSGEGRSWEVTVTDTGIGISREAAPRVFERFYRSDKSRNRKTGGAGIGLTIAAAIVKAHGGSIRVESGAGTETAGRGSVFTVEL